MLSNLDAHSSYFDPKTYEAMETKAAGAYGGVGLVLTVKDGIAKVIQPMDDTPAKRAGLKTDDILLAIDGVPTKGQTIDVVSSRMRGTIAEVTLTVAARSHRFQAHRAIEVGVTAAKAAPAM